MLLSISTSPTTSLRIYRTTPGQHNTQFKDPCSSVLLCWARVALDDHQCTVPSISSILLFYLQPIGTGTNSTSAISALNTILKWWKEASLGQLGQKRRQYVWAGHTHTCYETRMFRTQSPPYSSSGHMVFFLTMFGEVISMNWTPLHDYKRCNSYPGSGLELGL